MPIEPAPRMPDAPRLALLVVLAGVSAALHVGKLAPAIPALEKALGVSLVQAGFLLSMVQLAGMTLGILVGSMGDALGLRRSMLTGLVSLGLASLAGAWAQSAPQLLLLRAIEGFGFLMVVTAAPSLIRQLVGPARLSAMLGMWGAYMPLGSALALLLGPVCIQWGGWASWWVCLAAVTACMAWVVWQYVPSDTVRQPGRHTIASPAGVVAAQDGLGQRLRLTLAAPGPWLIALCFAAYSGQWLAVVGFLPSVYAQAGVSAGATGLLTALVAGINMAGNIASGRLLQRGWAPPHLLWIGYAAMAVGAMLAFVQGPGVSELPPLLRYAAVLLFSGVGGLIPGTLFSLAVRLAPHERVVSTTVGWMQQLSALGQFAGPPVVAWVAHAAGGWHMTWVATGACSALGALLVWQVQRQLRVARIRG